MRNLEGIFMINSFIMKSLILFKTPLVIAALFISILTCYGQQEPSDLLEGKWTKNLNGRTITYTLLPDSKYQVDFVADEGTDVWGTYTISGNLFTVNDEGGEYSADVPGVYECEVDDKSLVFKEIDDPLDGRRMLMEGTWSRDGDVEE